MNFFKKIYSTDLSHRAKAVYMYLKDRSNSQGSCFPSMQTIAKDLGLSKSTVKRAIGDLKRSGFLKTEQRYRDNGGKSTLMFRLNE